MNEVLREKLQGFNAHNHEYKGEGDVQFLPATLGGKVK